MLALDAHPNLLRTLRAAQRMQKRALIEIRSRRVRGRGLCGCLAHLRVTRHRARRHPCVCVVVMPKPHHHVLLVASVAQHTDHALHMHETIEPCVGVGVHDAPVRRCRCVHLRGRSSSWAQKHGLPSRPASPCRRACATWRASLSPSPYTKSKQCWYYRKYTEVVRKVWSAWTCS